MLVTLFGSKLRAKLLGWLLTHADERYFVRQLAGILNEDSTNVSRELSKLAGAGILVFRKEGRQNYYQADRTSPVFEELRSLAVKTSGVGDILREALRPIANRILVAFIYGSFASGKAHANSDVDIMVIGDASFAEVHKSLSPAQKLLQREINPSVYPAAEYRSKLVAGNHFLSSVREQPRVFLVGDEHELNRMANKRLAR